MNAKSIMGNSPEEIGNALQESIANGFKLTLGIVLFVNPELKFGISADENKYTFFKLISARSSIKRK